MPTPDTRADNPDMGEALDRVAMSVWVAPHARIENGKVVHVDGYWRSDGSPRREMWSLADLKAAYSVDWGRPMYPLPSGYYYDPHPSGREVWDTPGVEPSYPDDSEIRHVNNLIEKYRRTKRPLKPVTLVEDPDRPGKYLYADGHHRRMAFTRLFGPDAKIPVEIYRWDQRDQLPVDNPLHPDTKGYVPQGYENWAEWHLKQSREAS